MSGAQARASPRIGGGGHLPNVNLVRLNLAAVEKSPSLFRGQMSLTAALSPARALSRATVVGLWAWASVTALVVVVLAVSLEMNGGKLVYSLDDPYIHLALARHIAAFHYGINAGEAAAPASSVLYPFLLSLFVPFGLDEFAP